MFQELRVRQAVHQGEEAEAAVLHKEEWDEEDREEPGGLPVPRVHNIESTCLTDMNTNNFRASGKQPLCFSSLLFAELTKRNI